MGLFLVVKLGFWFKKMGNVLKPMKNNFSALAIFISCAMVDFVLKFHRKSTKITP